MSDHDLSGTVLDGRYKVISPISEGAMGSVYRGERLKLGRAVAIKVMHEALPDELSSRQRFEREAKLMAMLEHPNCVSVIDFGVHDDKPFLVMELVRGTSLQDIIDKQHHLEIPRAADILRQLLSGLAHAHELGIIHRDIKPANIMVSEQSGLGERVRILDFGLARLTEGSTKLTTGIVVGTPNYMAPEQCKGGDLDGRTDLYACGVMLFEMLTGRKPFVADDPIAVVRKHIGEPPPRLVDVAPGANFGDFEAVVARALAKNATDRFESATAMSAAIDAALKKGAAQVFARAVPQAIGATPASGPQVATPSGWAVPASYALPPGSYAPPPGSYAPPPGSHAPPADSLSIPVDPGSQPISPSQVVPSESSPMTASQIFDPGSQPVPSPFAQPGSQPVPSPFAQPGSQPVQGPGTQPITPSQIFDPGSHPTSAPPIDRHSQAQIFAPGPQVVAPFTDTPSQPTARPSQPPVQASQPGMPDPAFTKDPSRPLTHDGSAMRAVKPLVSRKQLAIAGGGVLGLVILIAIVANRGGNKAAAPTGDATTAQGPAEPAGDAVPAVLARANDLAQDDPEAALSVLTKARKQYPDSAPLALAAGKLYFGKLWWTDGIKEFRDAIRLDPSLRSDPELLKTVIRGFITTPDIDDRIEDFMHDDVRETIRPYLEETAKSHPNKQTRARAQAELRRLH